MSLTKSVSPVRLQEIRGARMRADLGVKETLANDSGAGQREAAGDDMEILPEPNNIVHTMFMKYVVA